MPNFIVLMQSKREGGTYRHPESDLEGEENGIAKKVVSMN